MNFRIGIACLIGLLTTVTTKSETTWTKIAPQDVYRVEAVSAQTPDFRSAYLRPELLERLKKENAVIVDLTGLLTASLDKGIYVVSLENKKKIAGFMGSVFEKVGFRHKGYPLCLLIQEGRCSRVIPNELMGPKFNDQELRSGDIIALQGG